MSRLKIDISGDIQPTGYNRGRTNLSGYITVPENVIPKPPAQPTKLLKYLIWAGVVLIFLWGINIGMLITQAVLR